MAKFATFLCTDAQKTAANRLFAMIQGEDPMASQSMSRAASMSGSLPATHWIGGQQVDQAWLNVYQNIETTLPAPVGGWPWMSGETVLLTEEDAEAAVEDLYLNVNVGVDAEALPTQNLNTVLAAKSLKLIEIGD